MITNKLSIEYEVESATQFMRECPLTIGGLKNLFLIQLKEDYGGSIEDYEKYLSKEEIKDDEYSLFDYLNNELGCCDEDVVEEILKNEKDEYFIDFRTDNNEYNTYWRIWKVDNPIKEIKKFGVNDLKIELKYNETTYSGCLTEKENE